MPGYINTKNFKFVFSSWRRSIPNRAFITLGCTPEQSRCVSNRNICCLAGIILEYEQADVPLQKSVDLLDLTPETDVEARA